jgi:cobalt-zinc-cadmium efflux system protein
VVGSVFIITESIQRLFSPQLTDAKGMFILAIIGIVINGIAFLRLKKGSSLNARAVGLHILEDVLGRIAVFIGSIVMMFADVPFLDPLLSLGISGYLLFNVYHNLRDILRVVLQGTPEGLKYEDVEKAVQSVQGVKSVHDIHLWSMDGEYIVSSAHIVVEPTLTLSDLALLKQETKKLLKNLNIHHATLEIEQEEECGKEDICE